MPSRRRCSPCIDVARGIQLNGQDKALYLEFVRQFPQDDTFERLADALRWRNAPQAFRFAHMLKGLCAQLGLIALEESSAALCAILREQPPNMDCAVRAFSAVRTAYRLTLTAIAKL